MRRVLREICCEARRKKNNSNNKTEFKDVESGESLANIVKNYQIQTVTHSISTTSIHSNDE